MASIEVVSIAKTSVKVRIIGMSESYSGNTRYIHWYLGSISDSNEQKPSVEVQGSPSTGGDKTITGLTAGTTYTILATVNAAGWSQASPLGSVSVTTTAEELTPEIKIVKRMQNAIYVQVNPLTARSWGRYVKWAYKKSSDSSYTNAYTGTSCTIAKDKTYGADYIFNNLDRNTSYTLRATIYKFSSDNTSSTKQITITSSTASLSPQLTCTTSSQTSLTFKLSSVTAYDTDTQKVYWYYRKNGDTNWIDSRLVTTILKKENSVENNTITGLNPDTRYDIYVEIKKTTAMFDGTYPILCKQSFSSATYKTKAGASIIANAQGPFSIYVNLTNLDTTQSVTRYVKWECCDENGNSLKTSGSYAFTSSQVVDTNSPTYGIRGLAQGTKYNIKAAVTVSGTTYNFGPKSATTVSNGNFKLTDEEDAAFRNRGKTKVFKVSRWNELVNTASNMISGKGWTWDTDSNQGATLTAAETKVSTSDPKLYASKFNSLRYNIGAHYSTRINKVSPGDIVYGAYFVGGTVNGSTVVGLIPALNGLMDSEQIFFTAPS